MKLNTGGFAMRYLRPGTIETTISITEAAEAVQTHVAHLFLHAIKLRTELLRATCPDSRQAEQELAAFVDQVNETISTCLIGAASVATQQIIEDLELGVQLHTAQFLAHLEKSPDGLLDE